MPDKEQRSFFYAYKDFSGKNNIKNPWELENHELVTATNVDITDAKKIQKRSGFTEVSTGAYRNLWSNGSVCLATKDDDLISIATDLTESMIQGSVGTGHMSYAEINDVIGFTNNAVIAYLQSGTVSAFPNPTDTFKLPLPVSNLITEYKNRFYLAQGAILWWSDVLSKRFGCMDKRENGRQLASNIQLLKSVNDGIYLSDTTAIYFMQGEDPYTATLRKVLTYPALYDACCEIDGTVLAQPIVGKCLAIATTRGICIAGNGGQIFNVTEKAYDFGLGTTVAMLFKMASNMTQVITADSTGSALVVNLSNMARTEYSNYGFNSFAYFNEKYYGATTSGLYELTGDTDDDTYITSTVRTGSYDFDTSFKKNVPDAYLGLKNDGELRIKTVRDDLDESSLFTITPNGDSIHNRRVKLPLGSRSRYWGFELQNRNGSDFLLDSIEMRANIGSRRV